jgi:imidazoleglycerol-phosphate dehydratase
MDKGMTPKKVNKRSAKVTRATKETNIKLELTIEGKGTSAITTGIPFMDHMLTLMTAHGFFDLTLHAKGDIEVDDHHTVEDIGIVLGDAFSKALGDRKGINRYGRGIVPMDEALASVVMDFSNRPYLVYHVNLKREITGRFDAQLIQEFFRAFVNRSGATLHINAMYGENTHHIIEAVFKAFGQALDEATIIDSRIGEVRSTKGIL